MYYYKFAVIGYMSLIIMSYSINQSISLYFRQKPMEQQTTKKTQTQETGQNTTDTQENTGKKIFLITLFFLVVRCV